MKASLISLKRTGKVILLLTMFFLLAYFVQSFGLSNLRDNVGKLGIWAPIGILILRSISIVIPALPSTAYSILAGTILGFREGIIIICAADLISCSISFSISKNYGIKLVRKLIGSKFIGKLDNISKQHLENNMFLMIGFLMTGLFDFVSYAIGLTKTPWKKFFPALCISVFLSNPPVVALGAGLLNDEKRIFLFALLGVFILSIISAKVRSLRQTT